MSNDGNPGIKYSVIIAAHNVGPYIKETILSVQRRRADDYEIIIINDGSDDNTEEVLASIEGANVCIVAQKNSGVSVARNVGLRRAKGKYLIFLDGDDRLDATLFDRLALPMEVDQNIVVVYGNYRRISENGRPMSGYLGALRRRPSGSVLRQLLRANFIASPGMAMVRASTAIKVGGFDPSLNMSEDWNFWCRVATEGLFLNLPDLCLLEYRQRSLSSTRTIGFQLANHHRASEATFSSQKIVSTLDPAARLRLRRQHEGHIHCYISCQRLRAGQISSALDELISAIFISPDRCIEFASRAFFAWASNRR